MKDDPLFSKALLVEDETALAEALKIALSRLKIPEVLHATTISTARALLDQNPTDLLILDRNLPDGDGLSLCTALREEGYQGSILCLTAKGELDDRIAGLNSGADDYLPKPFHWEELAARVRALSRRNNT
jgi:DNA-binding response OmpR family regulator